MAKRKGQVTKSVAASDVEVCGSLKTGENPRTSKPNIGAAGSLLAEAALAPLNAVRLVHDEDGDRASDVVRSCVDFHLDQVPCDLDNRSASRQVGMTSAVIVYRLVLAQENDSQPTVLPRINVSVRLGHAGPSRWKGPLTYNGLSVVSDSRDRVTQVALLGRGLTQHKIEPVASDAIYESPVCDRHSFLNRFPLAHRVIQVTPGIPLNCSILVSIGVEFLSALDGTYEAAKNMDFAGDEERSGPPLPPISDLAVGRHDDLGFGQNNHHARGEKRSGGGNHTDDGYREPECVWRDRGYASVFHSRKRNPLNGKAQIL